MYALRQFRLGRFMKIKLKNKENPMTALFSFTNKGFCQDIYDKINSGVQVEVEKVPKKALDYIEKVKTKNKGDK